MSGKPAARQGDMTQYGGPIVQGSAGVRIGAPTGVACSVCPGGMTSGNPVNPLLGAKVLPGETDLALTAAIRRCALSRMTRSTRAGWWRTVMQAGRRCATATTMRGGWWSNLTRQA